MQPLPVAQPYARREYRNLACVIVLVALVHVASFFYLAHLAAQNPNSAPYPILVSDSTYYTSVADNILAYHTFSAPGTSTPTYANPPGYQFFLAAVKQVTGSFTPAVVIQSILTFIAIALMYAMGRRIMPEWLALIAAALYGLEPMVFFTDTTLLTDALFSAILVITIYLGFFFDRPSGIARAGLLGLLMGILALLRGTGGYLVIVFFGFLIVKTWLRRRASLERTHPLLVGIVYVLCALAVIGPWIQRNHALWDVYAIQNEGPHALLDYNVRDFLAWRELAQAGSQNASVFYPARHPSDPVFAKADAAIAAERTRLMQPGVDPDRYTAAIALHFILADPLHYAYFHLGNVVPVFLSSSVASYQQNVRELVSNNGFTSSTMYAAREALGELRDPTHLQHAVLVLVPLAVEIGFWAAMVLLALVGWFCERRRFEPWLFAALIGYFAIITGPLAVARYRVPLEPYLFLLAMLGIHGTMRWVSARDYLMRHVAHIAKIVRYVISGGSAFIASVVVYSFLIFVVDMGYISASITAFLLAFMISFLLQKFFTFRDQTPPKRGEQLLLYLGVLAVNMAVNTSILYVLVRVFAMGQFISLVIANAFVAFWNYFVYAYIIFSPKIPEIPDAYTASPDDLTRLSLIIPCHNEEDSIGNVLDAVPKGLHEVIVVDNNSTDATARVAAAHGARVVTESRRGYGAAVKAGFRCATGDYVAVVDGDNQHPAEEIPHMLGSLRAQGLDFISGSRFPLPHDAAMSTLRRIGNWGLTLAANVIFRTALNDSQSGMVMFKRSILPIVEPHGDGVIFVQEMKIRAARNSAIAFSEYQIPCIARVAGVSKVFPIRHGLRLLFALFVLRFSKK